MGWGVPRRPKISNKLGFPHRSEGSDGDTQVRQTSIGARLFAKLGGRWFSNALHGNEINSPDIFLPKAWHIKGVLPSIYTGTHTGSDNQDGTASNPLVDSAASFTTDALIGAEIRNMTAGNAGTITDNDGTTVTCSGGLSGGGGNDWDTNDKYIINEDERIYLPSNINKENILGVSFGVSLGAGIYTYMGLGGMDTAADGTGTISEAGTADSAINAGGDLGTFNPSASRYAMFVHYHHADLDLSGYAGGQQQYDNVVRIEISSEADSIAGKNYKLTVFFK